MSGTTAVPPAADPADRPDDDGGRSARGRPPGPAPEVTDQALLAEIARRYYLQDASKVDIGRSLGISRFKVARLLDEARTRGVVTITVNAPLGVDAELSVGLASALGLAPCTAVGSEPGGSAAQARLDVAEVAARLLPDMLRPGDRLGLTWSRTVDLLVDALTWLPPCTVVQLAGTQYAASGSATVEVARRAADLSGGRAYPVHAPLLLDDPSAAAVMRRHPVIATTLAMADDLDVAVVSIGAWRPDGSTMWDSVDQAQRDEGLAGGAVAEVSGRLLDAQGRPVVTSLDDMVIGATLSQMLGARRRVGLVAGRHRAAAVRAVVRAGLVTDLVVSAEVAHEVLHASGAALADG